jgi:hypothetical protein
MPEKKPLNLLQRISAVQADVTRVRKGAEVDGKYTAVRHDDVTDMLRPLMVKHGIVSTISQVKSEVIDLGVRWGNNPRSVTQMRAVFVVRYFNVDDREDLLEVIVEAHADEVGDKAPGKVSSYAQKYADLKTFRVPTGEDEEERLDESKLVEPTLTEAQLSELQIQADELFGEERSEAVLQSLAANVFQVESFINILEKHFDVARRQLNNKAKREISGE